MSDAATAKIKVNGTIPGHPPGSIVVVRVDSEGTPLDLQWRRRLKDAARDNCCEVVRPEPARRSRRARSELPEALELPDSEES